MVTDDCAAFDDDPYKDREQMDSQMVMFPNAAKSSSVA